MTQLTMRKQKASDKRTRRRQRGLDLEETPTRIATITASPMQQGSWGKKNKRTLISASSTRNIEVRPTTGGRQRSRKRSTLYNALSLYYNTFADQLLYEYKAEVGDSTPSHSLLIVIAFLLFLAVKDSSREVT